MTRAYAGDIAILITGRCQHTISSIMTTTFNIVLNWASLASLGLNPQKRDLLVFTKKYKIPPWRLPSINRTQLSRKDHTKYLGVVLDSKLLLKHNMEERVRKAGNGLYAPHNLGAFFFSHVLVLHSYCKTNSALWCSSMVVRKSTYRKPMERVQMLTALRITGTLRTNPTAALELVLNLSPIDLFAENCGAKSTAKQQSRQ